MISDTRWFCFITTFVDLRAVLWTEKSIFSPWWIIWIWTDEFVNFAIIIRPFSFNDPLPNIVSEGAIVFFNNFVGSLKWADEVFYPMGDAHRAAIVNPYWSWVSIESAYVVTFICCGRCYEYSEIVYGFSFIPAWTSVFSVRLWFVSSPFCIGNSIIGEIWGWIWFQWIEWRV